MAASSLVLLQQLLTQQQWPQLVAILVLPLAFLLLRRQLSRSPGGGGLNNKQPPGPWSLPIIGNLHQLGRLPHRSLWALAQKHGPVMLLRLGMVPVVVLTSPEAARVALKTHDAECSSRPLLAGPRLLSYGFKDVVFAPWSDYVREMRKLFVIELLSARRVQTAYHARDTQIDKLVAKLSAAARPVRLEEHVFDTMDRIVGLFVFGESYAGEQFKGEFVPLLNETMDMLSSFSAEDFFPNAAGRLIDRLTGIKARREAVFHKLDRFYEHIIQQNDMRKATAAGGGSDLVQELVDLMKTSPTFTRDNVKSILMNTFIGSIDTTSLTIIWAMSELIRNPRVLRKAQQEIRSAAAAGGGRGGRVYQPDMPKMRYLRMVVSETLRLHPPATLLVPRETMRPFQVDGYDIPAKTRVMVNAWAISRDPGVWKQDPEEFNPERFKDADVDFNGSHFEFIPFGAGRRICPGLAMGVANVEYILANLLYCFDWELPKGHEVVSVEEVGAFTFRKKTPLVLLPKRYHHHAQDE
uniref:Uncharacterized protein n=1 Tax=Avena sativa TaxID=4498 RepID=A0ACD5YBL8_AVESA